MTRVSETERKAFQEDGVVVLRGLFSPEWVDLLRAGVDENLNAPGPMSSSYTDEGKAGRYFGDYCNWDRIGAYRDAFFKSGLAEAAAKLMDSSHAYLFHEHVLIKEPGTQEYTPWHQDQPYYVAAGEQTVSVWAPLDPVSAGVCPHFLAGSHKDRQLYRPRFFKDGADYGYDYSDGTYVPVPDIDNDEAAASRILSWDLAPGDAVAFHYRTLHNAPRNEQPTRRRAVSFRMFGDDARYAERPGLPSPPYPEMGLKLKTGDRLPEDWFPRIWPPVAGDD